MLFQDAAYHESVSGDQSRETPQYKQHIWKLSQAFFKKMCLQELGHLHRQEDPPILVEWERYSGWNGVRGGAWRDSVGEQRSP